MRRGWGESTAPASSARACDGARMTDTVPGRTVCASACSPTTDSPRSLPRPSSSSSEREAPAPPQGPRRNTAGRFARSFALADQALDHVLGVAADTADRGRGVGALIFQADVAESAHRAGYAA